METKQPSQPPAEYNEIGQAVVGQSDSILPPI